MLERGNGRVINIASGLAKADSVDGADGTDGTDGTNDRTNIEGWSAYLAAKAALDQFTAVLAAEVSQTDIVVISLNAGLSAMPLEIRQAVTNHHPRHDGFQDLPAEDHLYRPEEPVWPILWLASKFGKDQNGAILNLADMSLKEQMARDLGLSAIPARWEI